MSSLTPYQERVVKQSRDWIDGRCNHNKIDNECCADFSCCMPELFIQDRLIRISMYNKLAVMYGIAEYFDA